MIRTRALMVGGLGWVLAAGTVAGCGSTSSKSAATGGESTAGGTTSASGATAGAAGSTSHTGGQAATAGSGGTSTTGGTATGGTGGVDCNPPKAHQCTGTAPTSALISDFTAPDAGSPTVFGGWGQSIFGGTYVYPANPTNPSDPCAAAAPQFPLTQDWVGNGWHITGQVGTYSGGGLWWGCNTGTTASPVNTTCTIDASAYTGISFTVSGNPGPVVGDAGLGAISVSVGDPSTTKPSMDSAGNPKDCGTCTASTCGSSVQVPVGSTPTTVTLTWAQLGVTTPNAITQISFSLTVPPNMNWTTGISSSPYAVDITVDDLRFTT
jgi:hypothetical protein